MIFEGATKPIHGEAQITTFNHGLAMHKLYHAIVQLFVSSSAAEDELIRQIQFLKMENEILRSKLPKRIHVTLRERNRLLKYGKLLGAAITELISIVTPQTFQRWLRSENKEPTQHPDAAKPGRPRTDEDIRALVLRLARENSWGYTRIHGELKKLRVSISRSTVANILRDAGIDTSPQRGKGTWHQFIAWHAASLWACDFFTKKVWTMQGLVDFYVLFFLHLGSRRVMVTGMTAHPDARWVAGQVQTFLRLASTLASRPTHLIHDLDTKFTAQFDAILAAKDIEAVRVGPAAPNLNSHAERWVLSIKSECLDHFIVFGESHLRHLIDQYLIYYLEQRPHQGLANEPLTRSERLPEGNIVCHQRLGGLLKHYERQSAA